MNRAILVVAATATCIVTSGCDAHRTIAPLASREGLLPMQAAPSAAKGDQRIQRIPLDFTFPVDCGGETIIAHVVGFVQIRTFDRADARNLEVDVINIFVTFTNAVGATFTWREVGPDHFTVDQDGNVLRTTTGRAGVLFGTIGRVVVNLETNAVEFIAGNDVGRTEPNACAALT